MRCGRAGVITSSILHRACVHAFHVEWWNYMQLNTANCVLSGELPFNGCTNLRVLAYRTFRHTGIVSISPGFAFWVLGGLSTWRCHASSNELFDDARARCNAVKPFLIGNHNIVLPLRQWVHFAKQGSHVSYQCFSRNAIYASKERSDSEFLFLYGCELNPHSFHPWKLRLVAVGAYIARSD